MQDTMIASFSLKSPLPLNVVAWQSGWRQTETANRSTGKVKGPARSETGQSRLRDAARNLHKLRHKCVDSIFRMSSSLTLCNESAEQQMGSYAATLADFCCDKRNAGCRGQPATLSAHKRQWPLEFEWCFPNETDELGRVASMRSACPAFEVLCIAVAAFCVMVKTTLFQAAQYKQHTPHNLRRCAACLASISCCMPYHKTDALLAVDAECMRDLFKCGRLGDDAAPWWETLSAKTIFNASQWSRLRRQSLPLLLLPSWQTIIVRYLLFQAHVLEFREVAPDGVTVPALKKMNRTLLASRDLLRSLKMFLTIENHLKTYQLTLAQSQYDTVLKAYHKLRAQCLLNQARFAISQGCSAEAYGLALQSKESWWAFDDIDAPVCIVMKKDCDRIIDDAMVATTAAASPEVVRKWQTQHGLVAAAQ